MGGLKILLKRALMSCFGFVIMGFSIAALRIIDLGTDPFSAMNLGISALTGVSFGTLMAVSQIPLFLIILRKRIKLIGIGTVAGMFGVGYIADFFCYFVFSDFAEYAASDWVVRLIFLVFILVVLAMGAAVYMIANIGMIPYDGLVLVIEALTGGKVKFKWARLSMDGICTVAALLLGSTIGIATAMTVFCMGPFISFFRNKIGAFADKRIFV
jgi:uncharacterized membrane protein YczE